MERDNSLSILGEGTISGGEYSKISVNGEATTIGSIKCEVLKVNGECSIKEDFVAEQIKIRGEVIADKVVKTENIKVNGEVEFNSQCSLGDVSILGEAKYKDNMSFNNYKNLGEITAYKDCEGQSFISTGEVDIRGLLSADNIEIKLNGESFINEIGGSKIDISVKRNLFARRYVMRCNIIEGDEVILENTVADVVRGINVKILKGCTIKKVEYTNSIEVDKDSIVKEEVCQKN